MSKNIEFRRESLHNELLDADIEYNFIEFKYDNIEKEMIEINYKDALVHCYDIFRMLKEYSDIVTRYYFIKDVFYIYLK